MQAVLLALAVLPCVPSFTILLAGWIRDPVRHPGGVHGSTEAEVQRAAEQTRGLYRAGGVALGVGAVCGLAVVWTVMRHRDPEEEEDEPAV